MWPHGGAAVTEAQFANITAHLYEDEQLNPVACAFAAPVRLWAALNNEPARSIALGKPRSASQGGRTFTLWDFNDIDVSAARNPANRINFFVTVDGYETRRNIWTHGAEARTLAPQQTTPTSVLTAAAPAYDARIEIVWPHGGAAVTEARLANIGALLFRQGTLQAVGPVQPAPAARLHWALNNGVNPAAERAPRGAPRTVSAGGLTWLVYDFNDIDISPANDPANRLYFWVEVEGAPTSPNIWTHGASGLTIAPLQDLPARSCR